MMSLTYIIIWTVFFGCIAFAVVFMEVFSYQFFRYALIVAFLSSLLFAVLSFIVVSRRLSFLAVGTEHAAFGAVGLARILNLPDFPVTFIVCILLTVLAGRRSRLSSDAHTGIIFSSSMAVGMILLALSSGSAGTFNLTAFLFGNILGISFPFLVFAFILTAFILVLLLPAFGKILYLSFDRDGAEVAGARADLWDMIVYASLSAGVVLGIKLVGVLLVAALTVLPASFALLWGRGVKSSLWAALLYTLFCFYLGIFLSVFLDIPPGALIVVLAAGIYFIAKFIVERRYI